MSEIKFVDVKGVRTRYIEAGSGEPLILIHGNGGSDQHGGDVVQHVRQRHRHEQSDQRLRRSGPEPPLGPLHIETRAGLSDDRRARRLMQGDVLGAVDRHPAAVAEVHPLVDDLRSDPVA